MSMVLYELVGRDGLRYSQFSWRSRLALAHKGLDASFCPVAVSDKAALAFSGQDKVPVLVDGARVVPDSWAIATYLEEHYPDRPSLFGDATARALAAFAAQWVDRQVVPVLVPLLAIDVVACLDAADAAHLRGQFERAFGATLEELAADRERRIKSFRRTIAPARAVLRATPFLSGARPAYADYALFSIFQWARLVSPFEPLEDGDPVGVWREAMLDLFDGLARSHPSWRERAEAD
ncbi:glutathione S-transferase family protein [Nitratireductor sp. CAU 1489]|uniref:Glutathione S-transferase family protein n=2 Tax=Nitratireductor arenosus TaxID=2682096 RepID=A0A844QFL9_9HYPH|nr:glutathione S-transferase N-terminal domain-containing protein [Nitratireductor arenosus]MVA98075.1 glutathione S-transferase family protein [Nitratireductor arenosus]